jgi:hypothetical protein
MVMNGKHIRILKEAVVANLKALTQYVSLEIETSYNIWQPLHQVSRSFDVKESRNYR